jgi:capsule biosynthesis phosphatase
MRIMIDLDGTVAELKKDGQTYLDVRVNSGAIQKLKDLKAAGHYLIFQTARHMKTCDGDQGKVVARVGKVTLDWLESNDIPYDEIYFGKPYADVYIDDLAHRFTSWDEITVDQFNTKKVNILIPMAGAGSRFVKAGFSDPKPLIDVLGEPMITWAMKSFNFLEKINDYQLIFIILKEHAEKYHIDESLKAIFGTQIKVIVLDSITRGQAETCLMAKKYINNYNKLFIYNCDTYSTSNIWDMIEKENPDGIIPCFLATDRRYSYAKNDSYGYVCEIAEKKTISNLASTGMYYFKRGSDFVSTVETMIENNVTFNNEFYVAPCYNELLKSGKKVKTILIDENYVMGTPEELDSFVKNYKK